MPVLYDCSFTWNGQNGEKKVEKEEEKRRRKKEKNVVGANNCQCIYFCAMQAGVTCKNMTNYTTSQEMYRPGVVGSGL